MTIQLIVEGDYYEVQLTFIAEYSITHSLRSSLTVITTFTIFITATIATDESRSGNNDESQEWLATMIKEQVKHTKVG